MFRFVLVAALAALAVAAVAWFELVTFRWFRLVIAPLLTEETGEVDLPFCKLS